MGKYIYVCVFPSYIYMNTYMHIYICMPYSIFSERHEVRENNKSSCDNADAFLVFQNVILNGKCRLFLLPAGSVSSYTANLNNPYSMYDEF